MPPETVQEEQAQQSATLSVEFPAEAVQALAAAAGGPDKVADYVIKALGIAMGILERAQEGYTEVSVRNPKTGERKVWGERLGPK